jgi:hypothetical protein
VNIFIAPLQFEREEAKILQYGQEDENTKSYMIDNIREYSTPVELAPE